MPILLKEACRLLDTIAFKIIQILKSSKIWKNWSYLQQQIRFLGSPGMWIMIKIDECKTLFYLHSETRWFFCRYYFEVWKCSAFWLVIFRFLAAYEKKKNLSLMLQLIAYPTSLCYLGLLLKDNMYPYNVLVRPIGWYA